MKAFLIDPHQRTVSEVIHTGTIESAYAHTRCDCITVVRLPNSDILYLDDDGLSKPRQAFFTLAGYASPFAGYGLIVGTDRSGDDVQPRITLATLRQYVRWLDRKEAQLMHYQDQAELARAARMRMRDDRNVFVIVPAPVDFPEE